MSVKRQKHPKGVKSHKKSSFRVPARFNKVAPGIIVFALVAGLGIWMLNTSRAATFAVSKEAESGTIAGNASTVSDANASGSSAVKFGSTSSGGGGNCTNPVWSTSVARGEQSFLGGDTWWVDNDAWNGSHGPQTIYACSPSSWYAVSNQTDNGGQVETYPNTEYDVGGRSTPSTKTIAQYSSITSTFSENFPVAGSWDAAYDLWTNNWSNETMIWNQWTGDPSYWPTQATTALTLNGVPYHFLDLSGELMFFRDTQVTSGSADILAAYQWEVAHGYAKSTDVITQLEYGVEICGTNGSQTFPLTGVTFAVN